MKFFDLSLESFVAQAKGKGLSAAQIAEIFFKIETHQNGRDPYWTTDSYEQHLTSDDRVFYTENKGEITGFIFYKSIEPEIEVTHWAVKFKGIGEGSVVLGLFLSQIASRAYKVILECGEWNQRALKLYEAFLFNKVAFRPKYYRSGEGAWILERNHNS